MNSRGFMSGMWSVYYTNVSSRSIRKSWTPLMCLDSCGSIHPWHRVECGWEGITKDRCLEFGCCFDPTHRYSLWCFQKEQRATGKALAAIGASDAWRLCADGCRDYFYSLLAIPTCRIHVIYSEQRNCCEVQPGVCNDYVDWLCNIAFTRKRVIRFPQN